MENKEEKAETLPLASRKPQREPATFLFSSTCWQLLTCLITCLVLSLGLNIKVH